MHARLYIYNILSLNNLRVEKITITLVKVMPIVPLNSNAQLKTIVVPIAILVPIVRELGH